MDLFRVKKRLLALRDIKLTAEIRERTKIILFFFFFGYKQAGPPSADAC